eukprot:TRINITY_DN8973_c0_g1_i2.p1 TRINITY_DN8973_c0_g1~~TRINITY_DN8973_c0_g1_i2.p1  ORF type:complete len:622 (-),score=153.34 TRINITY_DN8973_c0_g1_i2:74-1939(-)
MANNEKTTPASSALASSSSSSPQNVLRHSVGGIGKEKQEDERKKKGFGLFRRNKKEKEKEKKPNKGQQKGTVNLSTPFNFAHKVHVDEDYNWSLANPLEVFDLEQKLGEGSYGSVYKALHKETGWISAIKILSDLEDSEEIKNEIDLMRKFKHPNIVSYYGTCTPKEAPSEQDDKEAKPTEIWIIMDYCGLGSVRDMLEVREKGLSEEHIMMILLGVVKGLLYLHAMKVVHRDVKAANILLDEKATIKIADFGVSGQLAQGSELTDKIGSPLWMAPEVIAQENYDEKADIWSLGITIIEMADGIPPRANLNPRWAMNTILHQDPPTLEDPSKWSKELNDLISKCLKKKPAERPTAAGLMAHPFIVNALRKNGTAVMKSLVDECLEARAKIKEEKGKLSSKQEEIQKNAEVFSTTVMATQVEEEEDSFSTTVMASDDGPSSSRDSTGSRESQPLSARETDSRIQTSWGTTVIVDDEEDERTGSTVIVSPIASSPRSPRVPGRKLERSREVVGKSGRSGSIKTTDISGIVSHLDANGLLLVPSRTAEERMNSFEGEIRKLIVNYGQQITSDLAREKKMLLTELVSPDVDGEANQAINQLLTTKMMDVFNEEFERLFMSLRASV